MPDTLTPEQMRIVRAARAVVYEIEQGTGEPDDEQWAELRAAHIDAMAEADAWAEVKSAIGEGFVVTVTLNTLGTYVAAAWPGGNYVGDPPYLTDRPEATADDALRALVLAILRGTPE
jgi:hypothetical protein